ncbi:MAG: hypothetical protein AAF288_01440 [Planctomycetota bacterium]
MTHPVRLGMACAVLLTTVTAGVAQAQGSPDASATPPPLPAALTGGWGTTESAAAVLSPNITREWAYGIGLRLPQGTRPVVDVSSQVVGAWRLPNGGRLTLRALPGDSAIELKPASDDVIEAIRMTDFGRARVALRVWGQTDAGKPGVLLIVRSRALGAAEDAPESWVGHGLIRLQPTLLAELVYEAGTGDPQAAEAACRAVLRSVEALPPAELDRARRDALRWTSAWRASLPQPRYASRWAEPRAFALYRDERLVGAALARLSSPSAESTGASDGPGERPQELKIVSQWVEGPDVVASREAVFRVDASGEGERWSIRTARQRVGFDANQPGAVRAWAETGLRGPRRSDPGAPPLNRLVVDREGAPPAAVLDYVLNRKDRGLRFIGPDRNQLAGAAAAPPDPTPVGAAPGGQFVTQTWSTPGLAYLDQIDLRVGLEHLPIDFPRAFMFYAYDPSLAKLTLHRGEVEPRAQGGAWVRVRPGPSAPQTVYRLGSDGRLVQIDRPDGVSWRPGRAARVRAELRAAGLDGQITLMRAGPGPPG